VTARPSRWLVTGGCGFVGVNLLPRLVERGVAVRVLDDLSVGRAEDIAGFGAELVVGDIRDAAAVDRSLDGVDVVVHLAAHTRVIESIENPALNFDVNARGTLTMLEGVRRRGGIRRFILASTGGAILGDVEPPVHEGMPARPLAPYGAGKLACEGYCSAYFGSYGIPTVALRFSNVYGPWSYQKGSVVAAFFKRILANQPLVIYGDGRATRDFLYVGDLCQAILAAATHDCGGQVFHIAAGQETAVGTLARLMLEVTGAPVPIHHEPARRGEVQRNTALITHAKAILGWTPTMPLEEGLRDTWAWFQQQ
jgi:UDP-glucose 4-epimerase